MLKRQTRWTPFLSLFAEYPHLLPMPALSPSYPPLPDIHHAKILQMGKAVRATKFADVEDQRVFLDGKVAFFVRIFLIYRWQLLAN